MVFFTLGLPLMFLLVFGLVFAGELEGTEVSVGQWFTPGIIAASVLSAGIVNLATSMAIERHDGTLRRLALTPLPTTSYLIGKILMTVVTAIAMTVVLLGVGVLLFDVTLPTDTDRWLTFGWVFGLGVVASSVLGIAMSSIPTIGQVRLGGVQPAIPRADVHLRRVHRVQLDTRLAADRGRRVPVALAGFGHALGVPACGVRTGSSSLEGRTTWTSARRSWPRGWSSASCSPSPRSAGDVNAAADPDPDQDPDRRRSPPRRRRPARAPALRRHTRRSPSSGCHERTLTCSSPTFSSSSPFSPFCSRGSGELSVLRDPVLWGAAAAAAARPCSESSTDGGRAPSAGSGRHLPARPGHPTTP